MRYVVINGSPHKGNTWRLALQAMETISEKDSQAEFDEIHLMKLQLPFCCGCSACFRLGHETCPHSSIICDIIHRIERSDGVIILSSTFNLRETALLKNLFDHLCFMLHRPHFFQSKALILTTTGGVGARQCAKSIKDFLSGIGFNRCYQFSVAAHSWNDYQIDQKTNTKLNQLVRRFQTDVASQKLHSPSILVLIPYNLFRGMSLAYQPGTAYENCDGSYWTEEYRKNSVYDPAVPVELYKRPFGQLFYWIGKLAGKKIMVTYKKQSNV